MPADKAEKQRPSRHVYETWKAIQMENFSSSELSFLSAALNDQTVDTCKSLIHCLAPPVTTERVKRLRQDLTDQRFLFQKVSDLYQAKVNEKRKPILMGKGILR